MGNIQGVWILYVIMLILNFLMADGQKTATEINWIRKEINKIYKPKYF